MAAGEAKTTVEKRCAECGVSQPRDNFWKHTKSRDGLDCYCKTCSVIRHRKWAKKNPRRTRKFARDYYRKNKEKCRAHAKKYYATHPDKKRDLDLRTKYGISLVDKRNLYKEQNGRCANEGCKKKIYMAGIKSVVAHLDHSHKKGGQVRGLLCRSCNLALGLLKDDLEIILGLIAYVREAEWRQAKRKQLVKKAEVSTTTAVSIVGERGL